MSEDSSSEDCFTITEFRRDDPRLKEFLEIELQENKPSFMATVQFISGSDELEIEDADIWMQCHLTTDDFNRLKSLGLKGKLRAAGYAMLGDAPYRARTLIVGQHQIKEAIDLPQPDECELIYYQVGDAWRKFPADAPTLKKRFRLSIDPQNKNLTNIRHEAAFGSFAGSEGGINWEQAG